MKHFLTLGWLYCLLLSNLPLFAQEGVVVSGRVMDVDSDETLVGAKVAMKGKVIGTSTDTEGDFKLLTGKEELPLTLLISMPSYETKEVLVNGPTDILVVRLKYQALMLGQEVVVAASRVEESIMESPVTVEKMDIRDIQGTAALSFYDQLAYLKGIDVSTQSLVFKSINPRGFGVNGNVRTVQLIDGIDNQPPSLNFPVSNIVGISELDLESVEVIPGAASALYGPNAINGIILMNSKSPFEYPGLSVTTRLGVNHVDRKDDNPSLYQNYALRYARAFNNRFAFKVSGELLHAADFRGVDYRNQQGGIVRNDSEIIDPTDRTGYRTYDGVNVYGDPLINLGIIAQSDPALAPVQALLPSGEAGDFTPTGYTEVDLLAGVPTQSIKANGALHYRINSDVEALAQYTFGTGSTVYTGDERFVLEGFSLQTAKVEVRGSNFFLRAYTTHTNEGDSYALGSLASQINARTTIPRYIQAFTQARLQGVSVDQAHVDARQASDALRNQNLASGRFQTLYDSLRAVPISRGGAKIIDRTSLWHYEGMYNFSPYTDIAEVIVGINFRRYALDSDGTIFALQDNGEEFTIDEWGAYLQMSKSLLNDKLDFTASVRYDKNENFTGQFSPRVSGVYTLQDDHNLRASFQQGFRIPTTQSQFIEIDQGNRRLVGNNPVLLDRYNLISNQVYLTSSVERAQQNLRRTSDVPASIALLEPLALENLDTEKINNYEIGYRGVFNDNLFIDAYYYLSSYTDLTVRVGLTQSAGPTNNSEDIVQNSVELQRFGLITNSDATVNTHGLGVGLDYVLAKGFALGGNFSYNEALKENFGFNSPKWRYNLRLTNRRVTDNLGFGLFWRWQDSFLWVAGFTRSEIPAYQTLDAQVSYKIPSLKSVLKLGGANVFNERYITSFGNPSLGAVYYISIAFDEFLN